MSDVLYKDYFTEAEAADYCCVSFSQFREKRIEYGIEPILFMGKLVYRRADLSRAIEKWQQHTNIMGRGLSSGRRTAKGKRSGSAEPPSSQNEKPN